MKTSFRPAALEFTLNFQMIAAALLAVTMAFGSWSAMTLAAPGGPSAAESIAAQNVDWMSADTAALLDVPMDVLVPTWVPAPFDGVAPSITASGGYYQLYWMVPGGAPTFLYIEGTVGGGLPAGSPADLNKELSINASVQGWNAIHDIGIPAGTDTPIYDQVWWIANGVLYTVSSNNMTGTDTMSLANSLVVLIPPAAPAPPAPADPPYEEPADPPYEEPVAPVEEVPDTVVETGGAEEVVDTSGDVPVEQPAEPSAPSGDTTASTSQEPSDDAGNDESAAVGSPGEDRPWSPGRYESTVPSDGTNGPRPPVIGTDGTGGAYDTALPNIFVRP